MQTAQVLTIAPEGMSGQLVTVEVATRPGISSLKIVGLASRTVTEAKDRVRSALRSCGIKLPATNILVNLTPAEITKVGTHYDLPIALALLESAGHIKKGALADTVVAGELSLKGDIKTYRQAAAVASGTALRKLRLVTAADSKNVTEAIAEIPTAYFTSLPECLSLLAQGPPRFTTRQNRSVYKTKTEVRLEDVAGLRLAKQSLIIACAGQHNLLLCGSPGVGKSLLGQAAIGLLQPLDKQTRNELTCLYGQAVDAPPLRTPHHTVSASNLIGSCNSLRPGEISLAHGGILFLDELPRFSRNSLDALLEPIEQRQVSLIKNSATTTFPADCLIIGAFNPCPCGYYGDQKVNCRCSDADLRRYTNKLSGPLLNRFSIFASCQSDNEEVNLTTLEAQKLIERSNLLRFSRGQSIPNNHLRSTIVRDWLKQPPLSSLLESLLAQGRSWRSIINAGRVARTIADLDQEPNISSEHLSQAISWLPPF